MRLLKKLGKHAAETRRIVARGEKPRDVCEMMNYQHVGVAATFSPTFTGVFAEAKRFASHCGADLEIVHAGAFDIKKAPRFLKSSGQRVGIRWVEGETAASAIITAVEDFAYDLLVAGTPHRHMDDKPLRRRMLRRSCCAMRPAIS